MYSGETGLACPLTDVDFLILAKTCLSQAGSKPWLTQAYLSAVADRRKGG
jgi:hypothetical protein